MSACSLGHRPAVTPSPMAVVCREGNGGGGGGGAGLNGGGGAEQTQSPVNNFNDQGAAITDISDDRMTTQRLVIEFNDEVVDAISRNIQKSQSDGRT